MPALHAAHVVRPPFPVVHRHGPAVRAVRSIVMKPKAFSRERMVSTTAPGAKRRAGQQRHSVLDGTREAAHELRRVVARKAQLLPQVNVAGQQHVHVRRQQARIDGTESVDQAHVAAEHVDAVRVGGRHGHAARQLVHVAARVGVFREVHVARLEALVGMSQKTENKAREGWDRTTRLDPLRTVSQLHDLVAEDCKACSSGC